MTTPLDTARLFLFALLSIGASVPAIARQSAAAPASVMDADTISVPFEYKNHQILVHGRIGGGKDLLLMVDTGASVVAVDSASGVSGPALPAAHVLEAEGDLTASGVVLDSLSLKGSEGRVTVSGLRAYRVDLTHTSRALKSTLDGILGIPFFAGFVTEIDYQSHLLIFHNARVFSTKGRTPDNRNTFLLDALPASIAQETPCLVLGGRLADNYECRFLLDTGFGGYVDVPRHAAEAAGLLRKDTPRRASLNYSLTREFQVDKIRASYLRIGALDLSGRTISVDSRNGGASGQMAIVGNRLLQNFHVMLDYQGRRLWLEREVAREELDDDDRPALGLTVRRSGDVIRVYRVDRNSPARRSGVRPGDTLLALNGQPVAGGSLDSVLAILKTPPSEVRLDLLRGIDPNFGTTPGQVTVTITPSSPLDWKGK